MGQLKAKTNKIRAEREAQIRAAISTYAIKREDVIKDPSSLLRDQKTGLILAASNDDFGNIPRRQHDEIEIEGTGQAHARVMTATVLDTMLNRRELDFDKKDGDHQRLWRAGDRLRGDFHLAGMEPRVISTLTQLPAGKGEMSDLAMDARRRITRAGFAVGPILEPILVHVVCHDLPASKYGKRRNQRSDIEALTMFRLSLATLALHYGY